MSWTDEHSYPTEKALLRVRQWPAGDPEGWLAFARALWSYPDAATVEGTTHRFATGGWSGNEDIIGAMRDNHVLWMLTWLSSHRGGLFLFDADPGSVPK